MNTEQAAMQRLFDFLSGRPPLRSFNITNERGAVAVSALDSTKMHAHVAVGEDVAGCIIAALSDDLKAMRAKLDARS